jgi:hypothetical protein
MPDSLNMLPTPTIALARTAVFLGVAAIGSVSLSRTGAPIDKSGLDPTCMPLSVGVVGGKEV